MKGQKYYVTGTVTPVFGIFSNNVFEYTIDEGVKSDLLRDTFEHIGHYKKVKITIEVLDD